MTENFTIPFDKKVIAMLLNESITIDQYLKENERTYSGQLLNLISKIP